MPGQQIYYPLQGQSDHGRLGAFHIGDELPTPALQGVGPRFVQRFSRCGIVGCLRGGHGPDRHLCRIDAALGEVLAGSGQAVAGVYRMGAASQGKQHCCSVCLVGWFPVDTLAEDYFGVEPKNDCVRRKALSNRGSFLLRHPNHIVLSALPGPADLLDIWGNHIEVVSGHAQQKPASRRSAGEHELVLWLGHGATLAPRRGPGQSSPDGELRAGYRVKTELSNEKARMRWRNLERSKNVEDRRGQTAKVAGGVGGLGIIGVLIALFLGGGGGDIGDLLGQLGTPQTTAAAQDSGEFAGIDDDEAFVMAILGTTETLWTDVFAASGQTYDPARVVLFSSATASACGGANSATGPHYCPLDETVYIDLTFYY